MRFPHAIILLNTNVPVTDEDEDEEDFDEEGIEYEAEFEGKSSFIGTAESL